MFPLNLYARVRVLVASIARETAGAARTRSSLRPLNFGGPTKCKTSGKSCREKVKPYLSAVIPGRCEASNPESRDSGSGPSDHPGMTAFIGAHTLNYRIIEPSRPGGVVPVLEAAIMTIPAR